MDETMLNLAKQALRNDRPSEARALLNGLLQYYPKNRDAQLLLALANEELRTRTSSRSILTLARAH